MKKIILIFLILFFVAGQSIVEAKESCPEEKREEIKEEIEMIWTNYNNAVLTGKFEEALSYYSVLSRDQHRQILEAIDMDKLRSNFKEFKGIEINSIYNGRRVDGELIIKEEAGLYSYPVTFIKDPDCTWRIGDM